MIEILFRMKSTAKQEHNLSFKRNSYIPKMSVDPFPVGSTTVSMIPNFWCSLEVAAAELHRYCFVIKGNVWWRRTFFPVVTIVVLHHNT